MSKPCVGIHAASLLCGEVGMRNTKVMEQGTPVWDCELEMQCTA